MVFLLTDIYKNQPCAVAINQVHADIYNLPRLPPNLFTWKRRPESIGTAPNRLGYSLLD